MNLNFECHVTIRNFAQVSTKTVLELVAQQLRWKTSVIQGDPILGEESFFYFTAHAGDYMEMYERMRTLLKRLHEEKIPVCRKKIELVLYDQRNTDPELP